MALYLRLRVGHGQELAGERIAARWHVARHDGGLREVRDGIEIPGVDAVSLRSRHRFGLQRRDHNSLTRDDHQLEPLLLIVLDQTGGVIRHKAANRTTGLDEQDNGSIWSQDES